MSDPVIVTATTINMGQLVDLYRTSENADVVRAAMLALHGDPLIISFREPAEFERTKALELCAEAWNKREAARSTPAPTERAGHINKHGAYICGPCSDGQHLGVQHSGSQHAICQCTCDGMHDRFGRLRPAVRVAPGKARRSGR